MVYFGKKHKIFIDVNYLFEKFPYFGCGEFSVSELGGIISSSISSYQKNNPRNLVTVT
jgi:hypothetical protein